jgi:hypothetical protein
MTLRTLAFGEIDLGLWGSAWDLGDAGPGFTVLGGHGTAVVIDPPARIELGDEEFGTWWLSGNDVELESLPEGEAARVADGFDQLTRVRGRLRAAGTDHEVDFLGSRAARAGIELSRFDSVRGISAWFGPDLGLAVLSARPLGADGHGDDLITASLFEQGHALSIEDPRLSTTYKPDGIPARASVELWLEPDEADRADGGDEPDEADRADGGDEPPEPRPRRAAGEAVGPVASRAGQQLDVHAALFRWHAQGREGDGVYVLARVQ